MQPVRRHATVLALLALGLVALALFGVRQYEWNVSGLLHMDLAFGETHDVPPGVVLYRDGGYDGMLYYEVARDIPALFAGDAVTLDSPYRFQRILLPLVVFGLSLGRVEYFPLVTLVVNIAAVIGTLWIVLATTKKLSVHTLAAALNPAMLVGVLYALTEPLSALFIAMFFARWTTKGERIDGLGAAALLLSLLARETTVFLIGLLFLWVLWRRQWRQIVPLVVIGALFALWQLFLVMRLGSLPFRTGGGILTFPLHGPAATILWAFADSGLRQMYRLASLALLAFVLGLVVFLAHDWRRSVGGSSALRFLLSGLTFVLLSMDPHMWGALTSIGRVVTPFYPVYALYAAQRDTPFTRGLSWFLCGLSVVAAIGIAAVRHPFVVS